jgi:sulfur-oxidizing protein SoxX
MRTASLALAALLAVPALAETPAITPERLAAAVAAAWPNLPPELQARVDQDETMAICSQHRDLPPDDLYAAILAREKASIVYPADGVLMGDWKVAMKEANNGYGGRLGDDPARVIGGNCYACHQLAPDEVAYGNLGPSLTGYGKLEPLTDERIKATYEKIFNSQSVLPCSQMPRMGANGFLTPEQVRDYVAMLLHPDSPVNK